nr:uncharacterized protein LOC122271959 [Parasteatoda tepidariorum]XP_042910713.1 uncharacterized protein LOC122271959 [Parasteatoda tepidariorum]
MSSIDDLSVPDDYPARPSIVVKTEILRHNSVKEKKRIHITILLSLTYFVFGIGVGLYGPLYPLKADILLVPSYIFGIVLSCNYLAAILFYPVASKMVSDITCKQSIFTGIFIIGCCRIFFG